MLAWPSKLPSKDVPVSAVLLGAVPRVLSAYYMRRIFLSSLDREWGDAEGKLQSPDTKGVAIPKPIQKGIEFRDVSFRYPGSNEYVLRNISYHLPAGHTTAIVGPNGAGKTTLIKLLVRLYDPTEGTILVDGIDLREIEPESWWRHVSIIFQDFQRYNLSARENIGFGELEHLHDDDNLMRAAHLAGAETLIQQFPQGT